MTCTETDLGCIPDDPLAFVGKFYGIGLSIIGAIAIISIIYGGYLLMTSSGSPEKISKGKSYLFYAIIGLLLAILGFVFVQIIAVDIFHIPMFGK